MKKSSKPNMDQNIGMILRFLKLFATQPFLEIYHGFTSKKIPFNACALISTSYILINISHLDIILLKSIGALWVYPTSHASQFLYRGFTIISGFYFWGVLQSALQIRLINKLTQLFLDAGMKSPTGRMPSFIFDEPIDSFARKMRFKRNGFSEKDFETVKDKLESDLQIFIDKIDENRSTGTIDITYALEPLRNYFALPEISKLKPGSYIIGQSRSELIQCKLTEHPHALVAGATGGGKSTFIRQMITSLYLRNKKYQFILIDPKLTESHLFKNLPRIQIMQSVSEGASKLCQISEGLLEERKRLLNINDCVDFQEFLALPKDKIKIPKGVSLHKHRSALIVLVDEAQDVFGRGIINKDLADGAKRAANRIAAQGRALSIFIIIATQRPDRFSIDPSLKANLMSKICYKTKNNPSSMTILDNINATKLSDDKGRAIWQGSQDDITVQTPNLSTTETRALLKDYYIKTDTAMSEPPKEKCKSDHNLKL